MTEFIINNGENAPSVETEGVVAFQEHIAEDATPLLSLKDRRKKIVNDMYVDIKVPRWDEPEIYVRFKPVSAVRLNAAIMKRRNSKADDWSFLANADMLVDSCVGIYGVFNNDATVKYSLRVDNPTGPWTKFDPDLAEALGIDAKRAIDSCIALYLTEGDLIDTANKLFRWSNIANDEADEVF